LLDLWKVSSWALLSSDPSMQALVLTIQHFWRSVSTWIPSILVSSMKGIWRA
jgi:hypothetical protein